MYGGMWNPLLRLHLTSVRLKGQCPGHSDFEGLYLVRVRVSPCVTIKHSHIGSLMTLSHLTLSDLERSKSRLFTVRSIIFRKGAELGHMLLLYTVHISITVFY